MSLGCVLIPRFSLIAALGERRQMMSRPAAIAPEPGGEQAVGEVSGAAEAFGIAEGMALSEALARCPGLLLIPPDPGRAEAAWEQSVRKLEGIGAEVESERAGEAFLALEGLRTLWGPRAENVLIEAGRAVGHGARLGGGPTRFCAYAAATRARPRRPPRIVPRRAVRRFLAPLPVALLRERLPGARSETAKLVESLQRLGVAALGELAALPRTAVADRFGRAGLAAHDLARGADSPLRPRRPHEELVQAIGLPEAAYGSQLERALELLVERLVADPRRRGRTIRSLRLEARLTGGGSWRRAVPLRSASGGGERILLALRPKLGELPAPASTLLLRAVELGEEGPQQPALAPGASERRRGLLGEAVRQARAAAGRDAVLRVVEVDPRSRIPERWAMLTPHSVPGEEAE